VPTPLVLILVALGLIAQIVTIWYACSLLWDAYQCGRRAGVRRAEPLTESYRLGYDVGYERGYEVRDTELRS
jgi:hypothetical protein